ncbi:MAG: helical backbone metal receptor [Thermofilaceae archaeon]
MIALDKVSKLVISVALVIIVFTATTTNSTGFKVVRDALGRDVVVPSRPSRVVVLAPSITEALAFLGVDDVIVGVDEYSANSWYMDVGRRLRERNVTVVGGFWWTAISVEKIMELQPDLVLATRGAHEPLRETLESYNITVLFLQGGAATTLHDVYTDVQLLGYIFDKTREADKLIELIASEFEKYRVAFEDAGYTGLRILIVIDVTYGIWVAGKETFIDDVITRLGLINVANVSGWAAASLENIILWNPDIIIVACSYATEDTIREVGLYDVGKPIVILNSTEEDILVRPGPLTAFAPSVIYGAISRAVKPMEEAPLHTPATQVPAGVGVTETVTVTITVAHEAAIINEVVPLVTVVLVVVSGVIGYLVGRRR